MLIYFIIVFLTLGATFWRNKLLWAVYPPYTQKDYDALEVLDMEICYEGCDSNRVPSRAPMTRDEVKNLDDAHDFGGGSTPTS